MESLNRAARLTSMVTMPIQDHLPIKSCVRSYGDNAPLDHLPIQDHLSIQIASALSSAWW